MRASLLRLTLWASTSRGAGVLWLFETTTMMMMIKRCRRVSDQTKMQETKQKRTGCTSALSSLSSGSLPPPLSLSLSQVPFIMWRGVKRGGGSPPGHFYKPPPPSTHPPARAPYSSPGPERTSQTMPCTYTFMHTSPHTHTNTRSSSSALPPPPRTHFNFLCPTLQTHERMLCRDQG